MLIEEMAQRAAGRSPHEVLAQYRRDRFVSPGLVDLRTSLAIDAHMLEAARDFEAIELSPVTPLGTCTSVAVTTQNRVLSALRATEVVSDPTNVMALEIAARWKTVVRDQHLATSMRVVRAQPVPKLPGYSQHFRLFAMASGGLEQQDHAFTVATLVRHIKTLLDGLHALEHHGYAFGPRRVTLLATPERARLAERVGAALRVPVQHERLEQAYYSGGIRYMLWVTAREGDGTEREVPLGDGGTFDWLSTLMSNRRAVLVASGLGVQMVPIVFRARPLPDT